MNIEELPEREYIINWFGIGSDLWQMLKQGLSPIQCMKRLRQTRLRERIIRCKDCKHCEKFYFCFQISLFIPAILNGMKEMNRLLSLIGFVLVLKANTIMEQVKCNELCNSLR